MLSLDICLLLLYTYRQLRTKSNAQQQTTYKIDLNYKRTLKNSGFSILGS